MHYYTIDMCLKLLTISGCNPEFKDSRYQKLWFWFGCLCLGLDTYTKMMLLFYKNDTISDFINNCYNMLASVYVSMKLNYDSRSNIRVIQIYYDEKYNVCISNCEKMFFSCAWLGIMYIKTALT